MNETGWQAIGEVAKLRRERLGLNQDELAQYGGPRVSTVGKFERAAQPSFPLRTQHQMEKALGWNRGTIEEFVAAVEEGHPLAAEWRVDLVFEDVPDMSEPREVRDTDQVRSESLEAFAQVFRLVPEDMHEDALRAALVAILKFLDNDGASALGRGLREAFPPDPAAGTGSFAHGVALAAHDEDHPIASEQEVDEHP